jgi:predicted Holliday junction resolvase-like endonuclease
MEYFIVLGVIPLIAVCIAVVLYFRLRSEHKHRIEESMQYEEDKAQAVVLALRGQKSTISGTVAEKFCPFWPEYFYNLNDVVPVFDTCDFMVFVGKTDGMITEVVFQEMKSGDSSLSTAQRQLRECVKAGKVRWETWQCRDSKWSIAEDKEADIDTVFVVAGELPKDAEGDSPFAGIQ